MNSLTRRCGKSSGEGHAKINKYQFLKNQMFTTYLKQVLLTIFFIFFGKIVGQQSVSYTFPKIKTSLTMPVRIPLQEISNIANNSVKELIYEDNSYTDNDGDQFKIKVWKTRPIRLVSGTQQNLLIEVPLKIWAEKGIGSFGYYTYQNTTFETVMYFSTTVNLSNNWSVITKTTPAGYKWVKKPVLDYGTIKVPITPLVETHLKEQQADFCKVMDAQLAQQLNFQNYAVMAWNLFSQPFEVSPEYKTWLKISPISAAATPLVFYKDAIDTNIGIEVFSETFTGSKPAASANILKMSNFKTVPALADQFLLKTTANIPFTAANEIAKAMFQNKEFDFREGKKVKVTDISMSGLDGKVNITIKTEGALKGISTITGTPVYDAAKRKIVLTGTHYKMKTTNILYKSLSVLFHGKIVKMIEEEYGIPTAEIEDGARKNIEETFNKEYYKGLKMSGKVFSLNPSAILVSANSMTVVIDTKASLRLLVQGI